MAWREVSLMDERVRFVLDVERGHGPSGDTKRRLISRGR